MEVRQTDGQFQTATIAKLTDQSTYTVGELNTEYSPPSGMGSCYCLDVVLAH